MAVAILTSTTGHHIKILTAATFIVFLWFVWRLGFNGSAAIPSSFSHGFSSSGGPAAYPPAPGYVGGPNYKPRPRGPNGEHADVILSDEEATAFCARYRLKPFDRARVGRRKIYDLLLINTELEMLDIRLGQMASYVDYFVVLEADRTFTDHPKPLHVAENWQRFAPYHAQLIRRTMDFSGEFEGTWDREKNSRNAMFTQVVPFLTGDEAANEDDVLLVSDVDEIPKPEVLVAVRNCAIPPRTTIMSDMYYYSFQWMQRIEWNKPQATVYKGPKDTVLPDDLRYNAGDHHFYHGAWHCSYCFPTIAELVSKITSFSHTEMDKPEFKDPKKILHRVRNGLDM